MKRIDELVNFEQISEINRIVSDAKSEDLNLKNEAIEKENEQKRLTKEAKRQARKEMLRRNWSLIATGSATVAGFIVYTIKKIKK